MSFFRADSPTDGSGYAHCARIAAEPGWRRELRGLWCCSPGPAATLIRDISQNRLDGTFVGAAATDWVFSGSGGWTAFMRSDDSYVNILDGVAGGHPFTDLSGSLTVAALVRSEDSDNVAPGSPLWTHGRTIVELRTRTSSGTHVPFALGFSDSKVTLGVTDNHTTTDERITGTINIPTATAPAIDVYHLIVVTIEDNDYALYVDGILDVSGTFATATGDRAVGSTASDMTIGVRSTNAGARTTQWYRGLLNYVGVWGRVWNASEVKALSDEPFRFLRLLHYFSVRSFVGNPWYSYAQQ